MGSILYNPTVEVVKNELQLAVDSGAIKDTSWIERLAKEIGKEVQTAVSSAIQDNIVTPVKTFFVDSWTITVAIAKWGSVFGIIIGGVIYILGDQTKGKKVIVWSIIVQIIIQILNFIFLG